MKFDHYEYTLIIESQQDFIDNFLDEGYGRDFYKAKEGNRFIYKSQMISVTFPLTLYLEERTHCGDYYTTKKENRL